MTNFNHKHINIHSGNGKALLFRRKIRTKLLILILLSGIFCLFLFRFLWLLKWGAWGLLMDDFPIRLDIFPRLEDDFFDRLTEEAPKYDIPESEDDKEAIQAMEPFLELADEYTSIYIYGLEDGMFRTGYMPKIMNRNPFRTFFDMGYEWTNGSGEQYRSFPLRFKNGYATVNVTYYHSSCFIFPYFIFCLVVSIGLFLSVILFFVSRKMKAVVQLNATILRMSSGDLATPVPKMGLDEIGILARELDGLRGTLQENFLAERRIHQSNQELIAALSHDLRTPLTILTGYLEILRLNRNEQMQSEYVQRCLKKAGDIREMTERMFEYALVYDGETAGTEHAVLAEVPLTSIAAALKEHEDFLHLAGFQTDTCLTALSAPDSSRILADASMLKRIWNNLFSNIIKYADKKQTVRISAAVCGSLCVEIKNSIKSESDGMESTRIGLKSVGKMAAFMNGELHTDNQDGFFTVQLSIPLVQYPAREADE